ncbi:TetR family transcriptional regulator [Actinocrispum sp. NPDC049592]|uniref:TetR/AcrR family transcriptional regulator n=1 Tax=Actinocrispum sp. NPDC049592 TaxID=3154835 RepID=UPI00341F12A6
MGRVSKAAAAQHREQVVEAASRLFRERGVQAVGLSDVMAAVGLTPGGFYKQFESKQALAAEATSRAFALTNAVLEEVSGRHPGRPDEALQELLVTYLSTDNRDNRADGCAATALAAESSHEPLDSQVRTAYADGLAGFIDLLTGFTPGETTRSERIAMACTLVGALSLARAAAGTPLSDEILHSARAHLTPK